MTAEEQLAEHAERMAPERQGFEQAWDGYLLPRLRELSPGVNDKVIALVRDISWNAWRARAETKR